MIFRSKAPLRIGLAGGGTDVSPYSDQFGGAILNATVSLYAHTSIELTNDNKIVLEALDRNEYETCELTNTLPHTNQFALVKGAYNRIQKDYPFALQGMKISTFVEAPAGSGLGTSSTLMVSIIGAFKEMLNLPLGDYDIAYYAYQIERKDLGLSGGKQDQYAATFGGFNFMEFYANDNVIVNPLRIQKEILLELEHNLVLYYTSTSRESAKIIEEQQKNVTQKNQTSIDAMHQLKQQAYQMKESLLKGNLNDIGIILDKGFEEKRKMAHNISNPLIEKIYATAKEAGSIGGKISGAGGGGFMFFYCTKNSRYKVIQSLLALGGNTAPFQFTKQGLTTWTSKN